MSKPLVPICLAAVVLMAVLGYGLTADYRIEIVDPSGRDMKTLKREVCDALLRVAKPQGANATVEDIVEAHGDALCEASACSEALVWQVYQLRRGPYGEKVPRIRNWLYGGRRKAAVFDLESLSADTKRAFRALTLENKRFGCTFDDTCLRESDWF